MKDNQLEQLRKEISLMIKNSSLDEERKKQFLGNVPHMSREDLSEMRLHLEKLMFIDASEEVADEIIETRKAPDTEDELFDAAMKKVQRKTEKIRAEAKGSAA